MSRSLAVMLLLVTCCALMLNTQCSAQQRTQTIRSFQLTAQQGKVRQNFPKSALPYIAYQLKSISGHIEIRKITLTFWNNQRLVFNRNFNLRTGQSTPWFARYLRGRRIRTMKFEYRQRLSGVVRLQLKGKPGRRRSDVAPIQKLPTPARRKDVEKKATAAILQKLPSNAERNSETKQNNKFKTLTSRKEQSKAESRKSRTVYESARSALPKSSALPPLPAKAESRKSRTAYRSARSALPKSSALPPLPTTSSTSSAPTQSQRILPGCVGKGRCTPVRVFFGTNRSRNVEQEKNARRFIFGAYRNSAVTLEQELQLGRAIVTVPRIKRKAGTINRPGWLEQGSLWLTGHSTEGDPGKHFVIYGDGYKLFTSEANFLAEVREHRSEAGRYKDHAFIFVHGYNTSFDLALMRTAQIAYDLGDPSDAGLTVPFGTPFLFSWPSAGGQLWSELFYAYDQESARFAVEHFKHFLKIVIQKTGAKKIHVIAHSMGNVVLLNTLANLRDWAQDRVILDQIVLASPDIDIGEFKRLASRIRPLVKGITMYSSSRDAAMQLSRKAHNGLPRAGDVVGSGPIVAAGIHSIDISAITNCYFCTGHSEYVDQKALLNDITYLLRKDRVLPPHERTQDFKPESVNGIGSFWRYDNE